MSDFEPADYFRALFGCDPPELKEKAEVHLSPAGILMSDEARKLANLMFPDDPNQAERLWEGASFLAEPRDVNSLPAEPLGADALDAILDIGFNCKLGVPLDEDQKLFLVNLSDRLLHALNETNSDATKILRDALDLGQRCNGGGAADQWRRRQRDGRLAYLVLLILINEPKLTLSEAVEAVAAREGVHAQTVQSAVKDLERSYGVTSDLRRRRRGRPKKH